MNKKSLGRGLEALLPKKEHPEENEKHGLPLLAPIDQISVNPDQPRRDFKQKELENLRDSIQLKGIIEPLVVRRLTANSYELISGERRLRAAALAQFKEVPVIIRELDENAQERLELALIENLHREDLNSIEEAESFQRLEKEFLLTHQKIAELTGRDRSTVTNTLRLLKLPARIQDDIRQNRLSAGHGRALTGLADFGRLDEVRAEVITKSLTVRQTEALIKRLNKNNASQDGFSDHLGEKAFFEELAKSFTDSLGGLKVKITHASRNKKLEIYYSSNADLEHIMHKIGVRPPS